VHSKRKKLTEKNKMNKINNVQEMNKLLADVSAPQQKEVLDKCGL